MKVAVDSGVLVSAYAGHGPSQDACIRAIETVLGDGVMVLTATVLTDFVDTVTDPRRFENAPTLDEAVALCNSFAASSNVEIAEIDADDFVAAFALIRDHGLDRDQITDALQAARLRRLGISKLLTDNVAAFEQFGFIDAVDPADPTYPAVT
ncbi:MAG: hypothetical protein WAO61_03580 [Solirubrobacterales bacterium]